MANGEYVDVADLIEDRRTIPVTFVNGGRVNITYRPTVLTWEHTYDSKRKAEEDDLSIGEAQLHDFCDQVMAWDLTQGGNPVPITVEGLKTVPTLVLWRIQRAIWDDVSKQIGGTRQSGTSPRGGG